MTLLTCAAVQRRLQAFHDRELPVGETIAVEHHIADCPPCARELRELQGVGNALRLAAAPGPADDWTGLQYGVISRMRAEAHESWTARAKRFVDDVHLVWIGLASAAATVVCAASVLSLLHFAAPNQRVDSLAAVIQVIGAEPGTEENPALLDGRNTRTGPVRPQPPTVPQDGVVFATLENSLMSQDVMVPLAASVSREGRLSGLRLLSNGMDAREVHDLVEALSRGRFEPAQLEGSPIAVSLVWVVAHTTVKPKT
jgi:hypothetical protein